jgi:hypothetical protein
MMAGGIEEFMTTKSKSKKTIAADSTRREMTVHRYIAHPISEILSMLDDGQLQALAADIAQHGLREPITLYQGMILDGRCREASCRIANSAPGTRSSKARKPMRRHSLSARTLPGGILTASNMP